MICWKHKVELKTTTAMAAAELKAFVAALRSTATYATSTSPASRCSSSKNGETATNSDMYKTYLKFPTVNSVGIGPNRKNLRIYYVVFQHVLERKVEGATLNI